MKRIRKAIPIVALSFALLLSGCAEKGAPEKINTKDYSRVIQAEDVSGAELVQGKTTQDITDGQMLGSTDGVRTGADGSLTLNADGDKYIHLEPDTQVKLEASGT